MSKKSVNEAKKRLVKIANKLPPKEAQKLALKLLEIEQKERRDRLRQKERQQLRNNVADIALGVMNAIAIYKQPPPPPEQYRLPPPARGASLTSPPPMQPSEEVEQTLQRLQEEILNAEDARIMQQGLADMRQSNSEQEGTNLAGSIVVFLISLASFGAIAYYYFGGSIRPPAIDNFFQHESQE